MLCYALFVCVQTIILHWVVGIQGRLKKLGWGPDFMSNTENEASTPSPSILDIKHYSSLFFFVSNLFILLFHIPFSKAEGLNIRGDAPFSTPPLPSPNTPLGFHANTH